MKKKKKIDNNNVIKKLTFFIITMINIKIKRIINIKSNFFQD